MKPKPIRSIETQKIEKPKTKTVEFIIIPVLLSSL